MYIQNIYVYVYICNSLSDFAGKTISRHEALGQQHSDQFVAQIQ